MAILSQAQVTQYAAQAGFTGDDLKTIVAIAYAESSFDTNAHNPGHPGDIENSYGLWQINLDAHPEVSVAQATDPTFSANYAHQLFKRAGTFTDWGTFNSGAYKNTPPWQNWTGKSQQPQYLTIKKWTPQDSLKVWGWITNDGVTPNINNPYHSSFEAGRGAVQDGVGIQVGLDTPVTSLTSGTVTAADFGQDLAPAGANWNYGGFVVVRSQIPGIGIADVFYRHMDTIDVQKGDTVLVGQQLGLSGGQTHGGYHPESTAFSTGAHLDVGINPSTLPYKSVGENIDPTAWLGSLIAGGPNTRDKLHILIGGKPGTVLQNSVVFSDQVAQGTGPTADSFFDIEKSLDKSFAFHPFRFEGKKVDNPVSNWPVIGGAVNFVEGPFNSAASIEAWLSGVSDWLGSNTYPFMLRTMITGLGFLILVAFFFGILQTIIKANAEEIAPIAAAALA